MRSYALCTVVRSAEGQVSGADLRNVWDRCGSGSDGRLSEFIAEERPLKLRFPEDAMWD